MKLTVLRTVMISGKNQVVATGVKPQQSVDQCVDFKGNERDNVVACPFVFSQQIMPASANTKKERLRFSVSNSQQVIFFAKEFLVHGKAIHIYDIA